MSDKKNEIKKTEDQEVKKAVVSEENLKTKSEPVVPDQIMQVRPAGKSRKEMTQAEYQKFVDERLGRS